MTNARTDRRDFMKRAAVIASGTLAAPYVVPSSALGDDTKPAASERLAMGYIGVGGRGTFELREFMKCPKVEHVAVADPYQERRDGVGRMLKADAYNDFRELLSRDDIDAVSIYTPDHWHVPIALAAARVGKSVFLAKPLAISLEQGLICRDVFEELDVTFGYGTQQRSFPHCHQACELVRRGLIGEVRKIEVVAPDGGQGGVTIESPVPAGLDYEMWIGPAPMRPYAVDRCKTPGDYWVYDYAIGYLAGWGAHPLDLMVFGCDADQSGLVTAEGTGVIPDTGLYDTVVNWDMQLQLGDVEMTFKPGRDVTKFIGDNGWISVSRGEIDASDKSWLDIEIKPDECKLGVSTHHHTNFAECVLEGRTPIASIGDAVRSDTISHLCDFAVRLGRKVIWDPAPEQFVDDPEATRMMHRPMRAPWSLTES